jgi:hypothetical protein
VLTPVLLAVAKSIRIYTSIDSVLLEGMIFRPRLTPRFTMDNLAATCGFVIEFFSHVNAGMTSDYLGFVKPTEYLTWTGEMHTGTDSTLLVVWNGTVGSWINSSLIDSQSHSNGTAQMIGATVVATAYRPTAAATVVNTAVPGEESIPQILAGLYVDAFSICFWTSAICVFFNQTVYMLRLILPGKWGWFWSNETLYGELIWAEGVYFINGPLFLPILMFLYRAFECHYPIDGQVPFRYGRGCAVLHRDLRPDSDAAALFVIPRNHARRPRFSILVGLSTNFICPQVCPHVHTDYVRGARLD